jgi:hypothetical protein
MKLIRQEVYGDWVAPFDKIKARLNNNKNKLRSVG